MRVPLVGNFVVSSALMSMRKDAEIVAEAPDGAADEQYSRVESAGGVEKVPDPASGGDDAA